MKVGENLWEIFYTAVLYRGYPPFSFSAVVQWSQQLPHIKRLLGQNPGWAGAFLGGFCMFTLCRLSTLNFHPQANNLLVNLSGICLLHVGVSVCA